MANFDSMCALWRCVDHNTTPRHENAALAISAKLWARIIAVWIYGCKSLLQWCIILIFLPNFGSSLLFQKHVDHNDTMRHHNVPLAISAKMDQHENFQYCCTSLLQGCVILLFKSCRKMTMPRFDSIWASHICVDYDTAKRHHNSALAISAQKLTKMTTIGICWHLIATKKVHIHFHFIKRR